MFSFVIVLIVFISGVEIEWFGHIPGVDASPKEVPATLPDGTSTIFKMKNSALLDVSDADLSNVDEALLMSPEFVLNIAKAPTKSSTIRLKGFSKRFCRRKHTEKGSIILCDLERMERVAKVKMGNPFCVVLTISRQTFCVVFAIPKL